MTRSFLGFFGFTTAWRGRAASIFCLSTAGTPSMEVIGVLREISFTRNPMAGRTAFSKASIDRARSADGSAAPVESIARNMGFDATLGAAQLVHFGGHSGA